MRYLLSVPAPAPAAPPLLCFLHGYDEAAPRDILEALTLHGPLAARSQQWREHCVIVAPQLPRGGDVWHRSAAEVATIVDEVARRTNADPARRYLTGFSFGGNGVFDLARDYPWAALWAVDPTRVPTAPIDLPIWLSIGEAARPKATQFVSALGLSPVADSVDDRVYLDEGLDHVGCAASAYADARVLDWVLRHVRA